MIKNPWNRASDSAIENNGGVFHVKILTTRSRVFEIELDIFRKIIIL